MPVLFRCSQGHQWEAIIDDLPTTDTTLKLPCPICGAAGQLLKATLPNIPGYLVLEQLGQGGMGQVYKARHLSLDRLVALKVIRPERLADPNARRRFQREARAAARLSHPNVALVYDAAEAGGIHFLALEYVEGTDLSRLVKEQGPLPVAEACDYVRQAALGLQHAHERGLVHRDVKPANLLLTLPPTPGPSPTKGGGEQEPPTPGPSPTKGGGEKVFLPPLPSVGERGRGGEGTGGIIKLLDLGLARLDDPGDHAASELTNAGVVVGTPAYLAPEQALDAHTADIRSDIYSLGCTLYYLLTGQAPFPGGSLAEVIAKHQRKEPEPLTALRPGIPGSVQAVVTRMMAKEPADRYQTPAEVARALAALPGRVTLPVPSSIPGDNPAAAADSRTENLALTSTGMVQQSGSGERRPSRRWLAVGLLGCGLAILLGLLVWKLATPADNKPDPAGADGAEPSPKPRPKPRPPVDKPRPVLKPRPQVPRIDPAKASAELKKRGGKTWVLGSKPSEVRGMILDGTKVTDAELVYLRSLPYLQELSLARTGVSDAGMENLKGLTRLTRLDLSDTQVGDLAPASLKKCLRLTDLSLARTQVGNEGLKSLKGLTALTHLDLSGTRVTGAGLLHLKGLTNLVILDLTRTQVDDASLEHLKGLARLQILKLQGTRVAGPGLAHLGGLRMFHTLLLGGPQVTDAGVAHLKGMTRLIFLAITDSRVSDAGLANLKGMTGLFKLQLENTPVGDGGLVHLGGLSSLSYLNLDNTHVGDAGLAHLKGLTRLHTVHLANTRVTEAGIKDLRKAIPGLNIIR